VSVTDPQLSVREIAGKRAREEARMLNRLIESMRLASFRSYLSATVTSMSAPVPDVLAYAGSGVVEAMQHLRPGHQWPAVTKRRSTHPQNAMALNAAKARKVCPWRPEPLIADTVVSDWENGSFVEAKVYGSSLEVKVRAEDFVFFTHDGTGFVMLEQSLPDTVVTACVGHRVSDVIEHALLGGREWVIAEAAQVGGGSSLAFDVGRSPVSTPWRS